MGGQREEGLSPQPLALDIVHNHMPYTIHSAGGYYSGGSLICYVLELLIQLRGGGESVVSELKQF
jgi:hypothetical protein